ncbi:MAG: GNAT family N-acetyltransferase [Rhodothermia bacterium]|nr:GNAT family N-acetyltransferase [Rhodothermia bacterium]
MTAKISLVLASVADAAQLSVLAEQTFRDAFEAIYDPEECRKVVQTSYNIPQLERELADPSIRIWLAYAGEEAVGYLQLESGKRIIGVSGINPLWLHRIYLKRVWTGQKVGQLFMQKAIGEAVKHGHDALWLTVWDQNQGAVRYYERWGFRKMRYVNFPIGSENPPTDFLMQKDLGKICIVPFHTQYRDAFASLNYQWIERYFAIEAPDRLYLENPEAYILEKGGEILFLLENESVLGTVALLKSGLDEMELAKLAIIPEKQGLGLGQRLVEAALEVARALRVQSVWLSTSSRLVVARQLYQKLGFVEESLPENNDYKRADISMRLVLTESVNTQ